MQDTLELVVRNATVVSGSGRRRLDLGVRQGRFVAIEEAGRLAGAPARAELDADGLFTLPGLIDGHVHFRQPGLEHKEDWLTGSRAAVMGGVTTVLEMPNTLPPTAGVEQAAAKIEQATAAAHCDFGVFGLLAEQDEQQLAALVDSRLVCGLKVFLGPTTGELAPPTDDQLLGGLALARRAGLRVAFHAEDAALIAAAESLGRGSGRRDVLAHLDSRPVAAEVEGIEHAARLLGESGAAGHILHLSSAEGLAAVLAWRSRGLDLTCEVGAHHCFLSVEDYSRLGGLIKCNPPVRETRHGRALLSALADGAVDAIASDHAPHTPEEKRATDDAGEPDVWRVAPGINGVETTLPLFLTQAVHAGRMTLEQLVRAFAERPAQAWGLWPTKGAVQLGSDADLVLIDLAREAKIEGRRLHGRHGLTPFEGWPVRGSVTATIVRGRLVAREGELLAEPGWGRLVGGRGISREG